MADDQVHEVTIIFNQLDELLTDDEREHLVHLITNFCLKLSRQEEVEKVEISVDEQKNHVGEITFFHATVRLVMYNGDNYVSSVTGREIEPLIRESLRNIEEQERRRHEKKIDHTI